MADIVKTVIPDGSGDYTTVTSWNLTAQFQSTVALRWIAECYKGGNLGSVAPSNWVAPGTLIYAAPGHGPTGPFIPTDTDTVAYMESGTATSNNAYSPRDPNCTIDGMTMNARGGREIVSVRHYYAVLKNCVMYHTGFGDAAYGLGVWGRVTANRPELFNCYINTTQATAMRGGLSDRSRAGEGFKSIINCTIITDPSDWAIDLTKGSGVIKNTYANTWRGTFDTADGNASPDTSAIGTNPVHNVVEVDAFVDLANQDATIIRGGGLSGVGVDVSAFPFAQTDIIGTPRPQGGMWDIGPLALIESASGFTSREYSRGVNRGIHRGTA